MYKYILLWHYKNDNYAIFTDYNDLKAYIKKLQLTYYYDRGFSYKVFKGRDITERI